MVLFKKILKWTGIILGSIFVLIVIARAFYFYKLDQTNAVVDKIHATTLQLSDVMGDNLPPDPGELADATVEGVDANMNGIRDDVELAIFKEYPNSAKTRAVLLQYALALQMEVLQSILNTTIVDKIIGEQSRADLCIADTLVPRKTPESSRSYLEVEKINNFLEFIETKQFNTDLRKTAHRDFYDYLGGFANSIKDEKCDIDYLKLSN